MEFNAWLDQLNIATPDTQAMQQISRNLAAACIPDGGLGRLGRALVKLAGIQGTASLGSGGRTAVIFAADHGVVEEGVSKFTAADSGKMVSGILQGKTAVAVLACHLGIPIECWDVGLKSPVTLPPHSIFPHHQARVAAGTANFRYGPAMTQAECVTAIMVGAEAVRRLPVSVNLIALGEMGMGNTTAAAALTAELLGVQAEQVVGSGAGNRNLNHKRQVVKQALEANRVGNQRDPLGRLAALGGLELAALAGACLQAAAQGKGLLLDGFVTSAAALIACRLQPLVHNYLFASHLSPEPGHRLLLKEMGLEPLLDLQLRVGEGAGALLLFPLLEQALALSKDTATFAELGIEPD